MLFLVASLFCTCAFSADDKALQLRFDIARIIVDGNTLLPQAEIDRSILPFQGGGKSFADVQRALDAVQKLYMDRGYGAVEVLLPEQELQNGVVHLKVVEARILSVKVQGNKRYSAENVRRSVPSVRTGITPRARDIAADLRLANQNPGKHTEVVLKEGEGEGDVDVLMKVRENKVQQVALSLDNTGTRETGVYRAGISYRNYNLFDRDQVLNLSYMTSPQRAGSVTILGAGYQIPLYGRSSYIDLTAGYSSVNSGVVQNLFNVSGSGTMLGAHYAYLLPGLSDSFEQKLGFGLDYRALTNNVTTVNGGPSLIPGITIHPVELSYDGTRKLARGEANVHFAVSQNINSSDTSIKVSRSNGKAAYRIYRYGANYWHAWQSDWQLHLDWHGQWSNDSLVSSEQFGAGGAYSVRGFNEREVADDNGYSTSIELYMPDQGGKLARVHLRPLLFTESAKVWRNVPLPGEPPKQIIGNIGLGLRGTAYDKLNVRLDWAWVVDSTLTGNGHRPGDHVLHFGMVYVF